MSSMLEKIIGRKKTPQELVKENQRIMKKTLRELDKEKQSIDKDGVKLTAEIKKLAKEGQTDAVKICVKDLIRQRNMLKKILTMRANVQSISLQMTTMKASMSMANSLKSTTKALMQMSKQMNMPQLQKILQDFMKQNELMETKNEMMDDAMDNVFGDDETEEEGEKMVQKVFDELGIETMGAMNQLTVGLPAVGNEADKESQKGLDDLESRLAQLKR